GGVHVAPVDVTVGELGIEPDRRAEVGDGAVEVVLGRVHEAAEKVELDLGRKPDRLAEVGDGALAIALVRVGGAPAVVGVRGISRGLAAALDDARAGGNATIRIVPLARLPLGLARGRGRRYDREQSDGRDEHVGYAHDPLRVSGWE